MSAWFRTYGFADVLDHLVVGAYPLDEGDVHVLSTLGIERVLNLAADDEYRPGDRAAVAQALREAGIEEHRVSFADFGRLPADGLEAAVQEVNAWLDEGVTTYVHCRAGWQRSAAVAAAVIAVREGVDVEEALEHVQRQKPSADPLPHQRVDLRRWWAARHAPGTPSESR